MDSVADVQGNSGATRAGGNDVVSVIKFYSIYYD